MALAEVKLSVEVGSLNPLPEGWRFRSNWRGKLILQRSYEQNDNDTPYGMGHPYTVWRDAAVTDIHDLLTIKEIK